MNIAVVSAAVLMAGLLFLAVATEGAESVRTQLFAGLVALIVGTFLVTTRRVKAGLHALAPRVHGIIRFLYWPVLGVGLFLSLATTCIEWHRAIDLGNFALGDFSNYFDAYNVHLVWATLSAGIFTGLLSVAVKRLWRAVRAAR